MARIVCPAVDETVFTDYFKKTAPEPFVSDGGFCKSLYLFYSALIRESQKFNLTAVTEYKAVASLHFTDSLLPLKFLFDSGLLKDGMRLADIGCGAGFPSVPWALASGRFSIPEFSVSAFDSTAKKIGFVSAVSDELGIKNLTASSARAEDLGRGKERESFDVVTARAVANIHILSELCVPLVKKGGYFVSLKGSDESEFENTEKCEKALGIVLSDRIKYSLPGGEGRNLLIYRKVSATPEIYPRQYSKISSNPL